jgi:pantoate--beta-alanine ligase
VIKKIVRELLMPIEIVICNTVREADGLAMSSRNIYLTPALRSIAPIVHQSLIAAQSLIHSARQQAVSVSSNDVCEVVRAMLATESHVTAVDYVSVASMETAQEVLSVAPTEKVCVSIAVRVEDKHNPAAVRLIDNIII